jgi:hypothetical protein
MACALYNKHIPIQLRLTIALFIYLLSASQREVLPKEPTIYLGGGWGPTAKLLWDRCSLDQQTYVQQWAQRHHAKCCPLDMFK